MCQKYTQLAQVLNIHVENVVLFKQKSVPKLELYNGSFKLQNIFKVKLNKVHKKFIFRLAYDSFGVMYCPHLYMKQTVEKQFVNIHRSSSKICPQFFIRSHVLPGFIHWLNVLFGLHPECCDAWTPVVLHRIFIVKAGWALVGRRAHWLHTLDHSRCCVEEAVACIGRLQALWWAHESWDGMHGRGTGDGRGKPGI